ncbi:MAG: DNA-protecting protein DprA [Clostridiales bacterium]|nr:DNA-protecting protein DprA [Clostridiales bacterium]
MTDLCGIRYISCDMQEFPDKLRGLSEPVEGIYVKGNADLLYKKSIAIVGSRRCSEYGKRVAMKIGGAAAANGLCVISGMAIGIDNFAHRGALSEGGKTLAVLGTGPDICYPPQHRKLYEEICDEGLIVSEYPPGTEAMPFRFPQRNRIIAGLSEAVVVVEARAGSGSLITAEYADNQSKPVFAVPGNITSQYSLGTNRLITEGAQAVAVVDDIFNYLGIQPSASGEELEELGEDERRVYEYVKSNGEVFSDEICSKLEMDPFLVNSITSILEIKGFVSFSMGRIMAVKF